MLTKNIEQMKRATAAHIAADAVAQGHYWRPADNKVEGAGCFIGCLTHNRHAEAVTQKYGMPLPSVKIAENIFEGLTKDEAVQFFADIPESIGGDGKDLSRVHWLLLAEILRDLPSKRGKAQAAIEVVAEGLDRLARGDEWDEGCARSVARAAAYAADAAARSAEAAATCAAARVARDATDTTRVAYAAADAARYATYAAARAAYGAAEAAARDAASDAEAARGYVVAAHAVRQKQAETFLRLLRDAPQQ